MANLIIWGCGGHGRVILDIARAMGCFEKIAFYDDRGTDGQFVSGVEVLSGGIHRMADLGFDLCVAGIGPNEIRAARYHDAISVKLQPTTCIHPTAWISGRASIGAGSVIMPRVVVQTDAKVGVNCILNTGVIVEHDCQIGDHAHLSPGVTLSGTVTVGEYAHLGAGAIAIPGAVVGARTIIGAGAVVLGQVPANVTAVGIPARVISQR
jgi:acetyltransferase EpsM